MGRQKKRTSSVGDLTGICKAVESAIEEITGQKPAVAIVFQMPAVDGNDTHWVTNVNRTDGVKLLMDTALKMQSGMN